MTRLRGSQPSISRSLSASATRRLSTLVVSTVLLVTAETSEAAEIQLVADAPAGRCAEIPIEVSLSGRTTSRDGAVVETSLKANAPNRMTIDSAALVLQSLSPDCWVSPRARLVPKRGTTVAVRVFERVEIGFRLDGPVSAFEDATFHLAFSRSFRETPFYVDEAASEPAGRVDCERVQSIVTCRPPREVLDLRLSVSGHAPVYFWEVDLPEVEEPPLLSPVRLQAGGSLVGWIATYDGKPITPSEVDIWLSPLGLADSESPADVFAREFRAVRGSITKRGFFRFVGLQQGDYQLNVALPPYAQGVETVEIVDGAESQMRDVIVLQRPLTLTVIVAPALTAGGQPWRVELARSNRYRTRARQLEEGTTDVDGSYEIAGLTAGEYRVKVIDDQGNAVAARAHELDSTEDLLLIELDAVTVEGSVTLDDEPLPATLFFGGRRGAERVTVHATSEGRFTATLPREGDWRLDLECAEPRIVRQLPKVTVERPPGGGPVTLDVELADAGVEGVLRLAEGGAPKGRSIVSLLTASGEWLQERLAPEDEGRFAFHGLEEGMAWVSAQSVGPEPGFVAVSTSVATSVPEEGRSRVRLTLHRARRFAGSVVGPLGPIAGARVKIEPAGMPATGFGTVATDITGRFETMVPADPGVPLFVTVSALGYTLTTAELRADAGTEPVFELAKLGGRLSITSDATLRRESRLVVYRNGVPLDMSTLSAWASLHGEGLDDAQDVFAVPALAPGLYGVCWPRPEEELLYLIGRPSAQRCVSGVLQAGGGLWIAPPVSLNSS